MSEVWDAFVAQQRADGCSEEEIAIEADKRATAPTLYDCAVAVWELDRPDVLRARLDDRSIEPDAPTVRTGQTLLFLAIVKGRVRSVRALLSAGADPRRLEREHDYLWWAAYADAPLAVVEQLLDACERVGIAPDDETLSVARRRASPATVELIERWRSGDHVLRLADATDVERVADTPLAPGDSVRIKTGPFATFKGVVTSRAHSVERDRSDRSVVITRIAAS